MAINKVGSKGIEDGSVASADFAPNTVTSAKLQDNAVTNAKLSNSSVTLAGQSITLGATTSLTNKFVDWQSVITADGSTFNTAVSGQGYFIDTTSAAHTITLPVSASRGDFIAIKDYAGTFNTNNLTIARNGHNIQGNANDSLISTNRASLVLVYVDSTKGWLYWEEHNVADLENAAFITATGGTVTTSGDYKIHTFTGDGCFVVSCAGGVGPGPSVVDYLVVAGGGGSGNFNGGGGGGGGFRESSGAASGCYTASPLGACVSGITVSTTTYPVTVGAGGVISTSVPGTQGSSSTFSTITSAGGGFGGGNQFSPAPGGSGGSGGGGGGPSPATGGSGNTPPVSPPQGQSGANGTGPTISGGGGGAIVAGSGQTGGNGAGTAINPSACVGTPGPTCGLRYFSGGGAGRPGPATAGVGGGGGTNFSCRAGFPNTGGGGGDEGGPGGKGIVIIRYKFQ